MVEPLERQAVEVKVGRHAAHPVVGFDDLDLVSGADGVVTGRQAHGTRPDDNNLGHQSP